MNIKHKSLQAKKHVHSQQASTRVHWQSPFLWVQIENAACQAGKPWSPRHILREAWLLNPKGFEKLMEQVIGRWFCLEAKKQGKSRWSKEVLDHVRKLHLPRGEIMRMGILVWKLYCLLWKVLTWVLCCNRPSILKSWHWLQPNSLHYMTLMSPWLYCPSEVLWLQSFKRKCWTSSLGLKRTATASNALMTLFTSFHATHWAGVSVDPQKMPRNCQKTSKKPSLMPSSMKPLLYTIMQSMLHFKLTPIKLNLFTIKEHKKHGWNRVQSNSQLWARRRSERSP